MCLSGESCAYQEIHVLIMRVMCLPGESCAYQESNVLISRVMCLAGESGPSKHHWQ